ncbi:unnamed protein product [Darwinula stevensoni]|uniref:Uncharacterized protein n=1 Tax=Darwinula stevensoni TaxID=69355 RepID=A0A7R8X2W5_9CRUS|nr:unnamed protein product [Darwinula stevensoni]CAG0884356.1 unnamed protein product [Darwinula stevensoni]
MRAFFGLFNGGAVLTRTPGPRRNASYGPLVKAIVSRVGVADSRYPGGRARVAFSWHWLQIHLFQRLHGTLSQPATQLRGLLTLSEPIWWSAVPLRDRTEVLLDIKSLYVEENLLSLGKRRIWREIPPAQSSVTSRMTLFVSWIALGHGATIRKLSRNRKHLMPEKGKAVGKHPGVNGDTRILEVCMVFTSSACRHHICHYIAMGLGTSTLLSNLTLSNQLQP